MKIQKAVPFHKPQDLSVQDQKIRDASKMYEDYFLNQMVKAMRKTTTGDGLTKANMGEKIYKEKLDQEYVKKWSGLGGVGLADMIYKQIKERYFGGPQKGPPSGAIPLKKNIKELREIPIDNLMDLQSTKGAHLRMKLGPGVEYPPQVVSPLAGKVTNMNQLSGLGAEQIEVQHEGGLRSRLSFKGHLNPGLLGQEVEAGEVIGVLSLEKATLDWQLDGFSGLKS